MCLGDALPTSPIEVNILNANQNIDLDLPPRNVLVEGPGAQYARIDVDAKISSYQSSWVAPQFFSGSNITVGRIQFHDT